MSPPVTPTSPTPTNAPAVRFALTALGVGLLLVGLFRVPWIQSQLLIPYAVAQQRVAGWITGLSKLPVVVDFSCTGADVIALCLSAVVAFPTTWRKRLQGAALGMLLISLINTMRIGSLSLVADDRKLFDTLHLRVWPAVLIIMVTLFVFFWMRSARGSATPERLPSGPPAALHRGWLGAEPVAVRFALSLVALVALYVAGSSWSLENSWVLAATRWTAASAGVMLGLLGVNATISANVLSTAHGSFLVTPTCIVTPLLPVYFAAAFALPMRRLLRATLFVAAPLLFIALGVARLLVLALPANLVKSHTLAIHAFNQLFFAGLLVVIAALWRRRAAGATAGSVVGRIVAALLLGIGLGALVGIPWSRALRGIATGAQAAVGHSGHAFVDNQAAILLLPAFQVGLFVALAHAVGLGTRSHGRRLLGALSILGLSQLLLWLGVGELAAHAGLEPNVRDLRAWSVLAPVLLVWWLGGNVFRLRLPAPAPAGVAAQES